MAEAGTLHDAFIDELRDTYDAERQLTKALPKLARAATSPRLTRRLRNASQRDGRARLNAWRKCSRAWTRRYAASTARASRASSRKASRSWRRTSTRTTMDACLIAAGQRAEHYEMAAYGTLIAWARAMGHTEAADLLKQTLDEEEAADKKLSSLAEGGINQDAADGAHPDEDDMRTPDECGRGEEGRHPRPRNGRVAAKATRADHLRRARRRSHRSISEHPVHSDAGAC